MSKSIALEEYVEKTLLHLAEECFEASSTKKGGVDKTLPLFESLHPFLSKSEIEKQLAKIRGSQRTIQRNRAEWDVHKKLIGTYGGHI